MGRWMQGMMLMSQACSDLMAFSDLTCVADVP